MTWQKKGMVLRFALIQLLLVLPGCALINNLPLDTPCGSPESLSTRVMDRWSALRVVDMQTVFSFATPAYRNYFDLTHINNQYAAQIQRDGLKIDEINIRKVDGECLADVKSTMSYRLKNDETLSKYILHGTLNQRWLFLDDDWWFVEPR